MAAMSNGTDSMLPGHMPPMGMMGGSTGAMPGQVGDKNLLYLPVACQCQCSLL
jgi:hypothetical protein